MTHINYGPAATAENGEGLSGWKSASSAAEKDITTDADFTGGTKPMSAGMILACGEARPMQYTYGRKDGVASVPRRVDLETQARRPGA